MTRTLLPLLLLAPLSLLLLPGPVSARPPYRRALADLLGLPAASPLNSCNTCHIPPKAGEENTLEMARPHNNFGARLKAVRAELKKAGKPHDLVARIQAVASEDSDGDGAANLLELLTSHQPGEAADRPTGAEVEQGKLKQEALSRSLAGYRWTPFQRVERPAVPSPKIATSRNPIDLFLAEAHQKQGLTPRPEAPKHVLLRRVFLDLIGLPPTALEVEAFLADDSADAYEKVVERLLASPRYGERWARHWMDVWRYSDWAGFGAQVRDSQPHVWHWRDWIVESLNAGKGYDRMVTEMLAADEAAPGDPGALRATGFLVRNYKLLSREKWMQDVVDHTGQAFLGLTLGCARCHDHMFDPITQKEYYQFRALFTPHQVRTDPLPGWPDLKVNGLPRAYDADLKAPTFLFLRGDDRTPDKAPLPPAVPEALGGTFGPITEVKLPRTAYEPERQEFVIRELLAASALAARKGQEGFAAARQIMTRGAAATLDSRPLPALVRVAALEKAREGLTLAELEAELTAARHEGLQAVLRAEELEQHGEKASTAWKEVATVAGRSQRRTALLDAQKAVLVGRQGVRSARPAALVGARKKLADAEKALADAEKKARVPETPTFTPRAIKTYPATSTGRRLALARWIAHRDNPLAARVAVNHVWLRHFGQPLAPSVFDFGRNGLAPTHPELLDWLAVELMDNGWSLKHLHKLLVTSTSYRRSSTPSAANFSRDPDNLHFWRYSPRRVEAEVVRDSVFFVAGQLEGTMGGPDLDHNLGLAVPRRSLYFRHAAEKQMEFLQIFDAASVTECYQRKSSIVPQQALALFNSDVVVQHGRLLARELSARSGEGEKFIEQAFLTVLSRRPTVEERSECLAFLEARSGAGERPGQRARELLVQVLLNHHEFVTIR